MSGFPEHAQLNGDLPADWLDALAAMRVGPLPGGFPRTPEARWACAVARRETAFGRLLERLGGAHADLLAWCLWRSDVGEPVPPPVRPSGRLDTAGSIPGLGGDGAMSKRTQLAPVSQRALEEE